MESICTGEHLGQGAFGHGEHLVGEHLVFGSIWMGSIWQRAFGWGAFGKEHITPNPLGIPGYSCVSLGISGYLWVSLGISGYLWVRTRTYLCIAEPTLPYLFSLPLSEPTYSHVYNKG